MRFLDTDDSHIDVFLDELRLCHAVKWGRSPGEGNTLPLPELLLTKTQVVELEPKDIGDLSALLTDRWDELWAARDRLADLVRNDWGLWRTSRGTFERLVAATGCDGRVSSGDDARTLERHPVRTGGATSCRRRRPGALVRRTRGDLTWPCPEPAT